MEEAGPRFSFAELRSPLEVMQFDEGIWSVISKGIVACAHLNHWEDAFQPGQRSSSSAGALRCSP